MSTATLKPSLTIKRRFNAPPAKVFAARTDPEKVKRWMGPGEVQALSVEGNPRTGGRYRWLMQAPSGDQHDVCGVYREVIPNQKASVHMGLEDDAGARIACDADVQGGRRRHADDAHA
jgi:uncharacterized protein YndB with AHSA1/START domain